MLKFIVFDAGMALIVLLAFFSLRVSAIPHHSLPDVEPVELASRCILYLTHDDSGKDLPPIIMLHGVADSQNTWHSIYGVIAKETGREVCTLDLRDHGGSPWTDIFSFEFLAVDVNHFMERRNISKAILIGHSMGGSTAMKLALAKPEKVEKLIVEDFPPRLITSDVVQGVLSLLKVMNESLTAIPEQNDLESVKLAVRDYIKSKVPPGTDVPDDENAKYIPIVFENGIYRWQTNLEVLIESFENPDTILAPFTGEYNGDTLFIYGTKSPLKVYDSKDIIMQLFPKTQFHAIEGAAHYIHPTYPEFLTTVLEYLKDHGSN